MQSAAPTLCTAVSPLSMSCASFRRLRIVNFRAPVLISRVDFNGDDRKKRCSLSISSRCPRWLHSRQNFISSRTGASVSQMNDDVRKLLRVVLWMAEAVYIVWLFLVPYAPIRGSCLGHQFRHYQFSDRPFSQFLLHSAFDKLRAVGIHLVEAPVLHPMAEGLNFVIACMFMFVPLLYTDKLRDRFKGSIDVLWGFQTFLTNTFLIPYMAIRLNEAEENCAPRKTSQLGSLMTSRGACVFAVDNLGLVWSRRW